MTISAYVFIEVLQGKGKEVTREIRKIKGVESVHVVTGPYDAIAQIRASDINSLWAKVASKIQSIDGIIRAQVNIIVD